MPLAASPPYPTELTELSDREWTILAPLLPEFRKPSRAGVHAPWTCG